MKQPAQLFRGRIAIALLGGLFGAVLSWFQLVQPLDRILYDSINEAIPLEIADDILIVAIDEASLSELGRWPWPRENHVELFRKLQQANVRAVAVDILFVEPYPDYPEIDEMLGDAIAELGSVVLPVFIGQSGPSGALREMPPIPVLQNSAGSIGHVHIDVEGDGVARKVYLREGVGTPRWPHFALALLEQIGQRIEPVPGGYDPRAFVDPNPRAVIRTNASLIPFMGRNGTVPQISYADVMKGRFKPGQLQGKIIFVGATAAGHVDNITTSLGQISGVEINANIFQALRTENLVTALPATSSATLVFLLLSLCIFMGTRLQPGLLLFSVLASLVFLPLLSLLAMSQLRFWVSPGPVILTLLLAYPLWNWLRLASAMDFIHSQLLRLERENRRLGVAGSPVEPLEKAVGDPVEAVLQQLDRAYKESQLNQELVRRTLEQLTAGVILAEPPGNILLVNEEAWGALGLNKPPRELKEVLGRLESSQADTLEQLRQTGICESGYLILECSCSATDRQFLLQVSQLALEQPLVLFVLTDISDLKQSEKRRTDALNFLSHDLRAPLNSVLALIQEARGGAEHKPSSGLLAEIEKYIRANVSYAENYIQLAHLEHRVPLFDECEAASLMDNAVSQLYHGAVKSGVGLRVEYHERDIWISCNRDLLERALINLIDNALKYSIPGGTVTISASVSNGAAEFVVSDEGVGLNPNEIDRIFELFVQGANSRRGVGLGLRLVAAVAMAHGGNASAHNNPTRGASFVLQVPASKS